MSKLKLIAALMCLLAAACQSPQSTELLSNEQLMEGLEDGVASETRFLMQHWGARHRARRIQGVRSNAHQWGIDK